MSSRRILILVAAIVIGGIAAISILSYVNGYKDEVDADARLVDVYKIVHEIEKGQYGNDAQANGWIEKVQINEKFRPGNAITDLSQIDQKVAIADLAVNQILVSNQFVSQADILSSFSSLLDENEVAISISVDSVRGVANLLVPGDYVNILLAEPCDEINDLNNTEGADTLECKDVLLGLDGNPIDALPPGMEIAFQPQARYLFQKVQILAIGQQRELQPGETTGTNPDGSPLVVETGLITLAVPVDAAQWIAGTSPDKFYLSLVPADYQPIDTGPIPPTNIYPAEDPTKLTPYGPAGPEA